MDRHTISSGGSRNTHCCFRPRNCDKLRPDQHVNACQTAQLLLSHTVIIEMKCIVLVGAQYGQKGKQQVIIWVCYLSNQIQTSAPKYRFEDYEKGTN